MDPTNRDALAAALRRLRANRADQEAWRELHFAAWPFVVAVASRSLRGAPALVEDVAQEVFLRLVRYAPFERIQNADDFRGYLATVTRHVADTQGGLLSIRRQREQAVDDPGGLIAGQANPEQIAAAHELARKIRRQLTRDEHHMLRLLLDGCTLPEMATILGLQYQAAGTRLSRLRSKIRKLLSQTELGGNLEKKR